MISAIASPSPSPRNAPCPCGSGKRYKDCHGALRSGPPAEGAVEALLREAQATGDDRIAAQALFDRVLALDATNPEANFLIANSLRQRGQIPAAIAHYGLALQRAPAHPGVLNNLGLALEASGDSDGAEACYRDALAANPQHADALGNLGRLLLERERFAESAGAYDRLVSIRRQLPPAIWVGRAIAQKSIGDLASAEAGFRVAAALAPDDCAIQLNIATVCSEQHRYEDAEEAWLRALELDPRNLYALSMLAHGRQHRCDWRDLDAIFTEINGLLEAEDADYDARSRANPFPLLSMPTSPRARLRAAQLWAGGFASPRPEQAPAVALAAGERLRVGFVSSDFGEHPTAVLWLGCWEQLDRGAIETFAYAIRRPDPGPIGERIVKSFAHFADVSTASTAEIVSRIRADRVNILVDLNGYTRYSRERIFALRPAPVQINSIGFPGTLGADWYDYIHVDRFAVPDRMRDCYSERLLHMPESFYPTDTTRIRPGPPPTRTECGLPERGFVFACFSNAYKILPETFAIWMRLLDAVPSSVLWLLEINAAAKTNLVREAARSGVDPERLVFASRVPIGEHVARNAAADLLLDTFPYGAHTTASDALLAGLPVLTCAGETLTSRIAGSQLHAIGLPELVTTSFAGYEALALDLSRHPGALAALRARLATNRTTHPLFDMSRYARDFEDAMERVWIDYAGSAPV